MKTTTTTTTAKSQSNRHRRVLTRWNKDKSTKTRKKMLWLCDPKEEQRTQCEHDNKRRWHERQCEEEKTMAESRSMQRMQQHKEHNNAKTMQTKNTQKPNETGESVPTENEKRMRMQNRCRGCATLKKNTMTTKSQSKWRMLWLCNAKEEETRWTWKRMWDANDDSPKPNETTV